MTAGMKEQFWVCTKCHCVYEDTEKLPDNCCAGGGAHERATLHQDISRLLTINPAGISEQGFYSEREDQPPSEQFEMRFRICKKCKVLFLRRDYEQECCPIADQPATTEAMADIDRKLHDATGSKPYELAYKTTTTASDAVYVFRICMRCSALCQVVGGICAAPIGQTQEQLGFPSAKPPSQTSTSQEQQISLHSLDPRTTYRAWENTEARE
jgi:hypothetical protein